LGIRRAIVAAAVFAIVGTLTMSAVGSAGAARSVRGFDGSTITVAGFGIKAQLPAAETGAQARFKAFNDNNEIKGIKIKMEEFADDAQDNATALSVARRLVTQTGVFAIVPQMSHNTPGDYLTQQHVPWFGGGFDATYCSPKPSTKVWGFSEGGCIVPEDPSFVTDFYKSMYKVVSEKTGKKHPTVFLQNNDNADGISNSKLYSVALTGAGFKVVAAPHDLPQETSDYTPYVQKLISSGADSYFCTCAVQALQIYTQLQANNWKGLFFSGLYTNILVKPLNGSYVNITFVNTNEDTPGINQMKEDLDAYQPGSAAKVDLGAVFGYTSADFFIQAVKKVAKKGKSNITPEAVQKVASTMTWKIDGLMGPIQYPKATVGSYPSCTTASVSDGTGWNQIEPYTCSTKTFSPKLKTGLSN
jgi:ABC-type branched-subunit amino acid transport system substrate-binding protein